MPRGLKVPNFRMSFDSNSRLSCVVSTAWTALMVKSSYTLWGVEQKCSATSFLSVLLHLISLKWSFLRSLRDLLVSPTYMISHFVQTITYTTQVLVQVNDLVMEKEPQGPEITGSAHKTEQVKHRLDPQGKFPGISSIGAGSFERTVCCFMFWWFLKAEMNLSLKM